MTVIPIVPAPAVPDAAEAERAAATQFFRNYTQRQARAPLALWWAARAVALAATLALAALLIVNPALGLTLFWKLAIPLVPALLVIAPGLWRQVCPMATMNQIPRLAGWQRPAELPAWAKASAFGIAVALFVAAVALRVPLLNHAGPVVGAGLIVVLALALAGGFAFKGRSGWCGTFCPLAPIQRTYGQAPLFVVKNGYCEPCVGCQKSCYDFNPRAAVFSDVYDEDPRHAAQRQLFFGLLPGLILGYFLQGADPAYGTGTHLAILLASVCASAGLFALARAFLPVSAYRVALGFSVLALASFYWFAGPLVVGTLAGLAGAEAPVWLVTASRGAGLALAAALAASGLYAERRWQRAAKKQQQPAAAAPARAGAGAALREQLAAHAGAEVTDRGSGITFTADGEQTLLEAIQAAGLKISYGCRAGVCGADPVAVCEGGENLSAPSDDELATLRRLGLEGRARMACVCTVNGPVTIDRDPANAPAPVAVAPTQAPLRDRAREQGLERVVIVGNGVAGMGVAEALRRGSDSLQIDIVGNEPFAFYNRMGIGRLVYDGAGLEALTLVPPDWPERQRIGVHRGQVAVRIDREQRLLHLHGGPALPYDRLVIATGARSTPPDAHFLKHANAFVLRSAEDAQAMRHYATRAQAKRALVVGGGVLGVEAADALHHLGLKVTLLQRADRLMNAQLDVQGAARLQGYLEGIGIQVVTNASVLRYEGAPILQVAQLAHGPRVKADLFVAALGIQANTFIAEQAGLALGDNGIRVDRHMRTSDPLIYAVGDVAELKGTPRGLWPIGSAHAATAAASILGEDQPYATPRIVLQLKCEGIDLRSQGEIVAREGDEEFHPREGADAWWRLVVRHGQLAGGLYVGPPGTAKAFTKLLQQPVDLGPMRAELRAGSLDGLKRLARA